MPDHVHNIPITGVLAKETFNAANGMAFRVPIVPNYLIDASNLQPVCVSKFSEDSLREAGRRWGEVLIMNSKRRKG